MSIFFLIALAPQLSKPTKRNTNELVFLHLLESQRDRKCVFLHSESVVIQFPLLGAGHCSVIFTEVELKEEIRTLESFLEEAIERAEE